MNSTAVGIIGLGEILWDMLPDGKRLGGAPFNFAFQCARLGHPSVMVSRVGADELGREIREALAKLHLSDRFLQEDPDHPTGTVSVHLQDGQPSYTIHSGVAYDFLAWDRQLAELFANAEAVCFGTLIQREPTARATVQRALQAAANAIVIYDINLRQHYYTKETIETSLAASRWVKLNDGELIVLRDLLALSGTTPSALLAELRQGYDLDLAALTRGENGCLVQTAGDEVDLPGIPVQVVDTIGAGDAFTAGLLVCMQEGQSLRDAATFANRLAAQVAASAGGTPLIQRSEVEKQS